MPGVSSQESGVRSQESRVTSRESGPAQNDIFKVKLPMVMHHTSSALHSSDY
jgi:hypothetical protein